MNFSHEIPEFVKPKSVNSQRIQDNWGRKNNIFPLRSVHYLYNK